MSELKLDGLIEDDDFWEKVEESITSPPSKRRKTAPPPRPLPSFLSNRCSVRKKPPDINQYRYDGTGTSRPLPNFIKSSTSTSSNTFQKKQTESADGGSGFRRRLRRPVQIKIQLCYKGQLGYLINCIPKEKQFEGEVLRISNSDREDGGGIWIPISQKSLLNKSVQKLKMDAHLSNVEARTYDVPSKTSRYLEKHSCDPDTLGGPECEAIITKLPNLLRTTLYNFQKMGVHYAVRRDGKCMIGDEMGLGKTLQAIAVARYYIDDWPMLIITPSSLRLNWKIELCKWLPSIEEDNVSVILKGKDPLMGKNSRFTKAVVISYDMVSKFSEEISRRGFKLVILDESHYIKSSTAKRTKAILPLISSARRAILLSGTPALSRPIELYTQVKNLVPGLFGSMRDYGIRYCAGHRGRWGWEFRGADNLKELHFLLTRFVMIRRLKSEVLTELKPKTRTAIMVECVTKKLKSLRSKLSNLHDVLSFMTGSDSGEKGGGVKIRVGDEERSTVMKMYQESGLAKAMQVWQHVQELLEVGAKLIIFAHHKEVMNTIEDNLKKAKYGYFRIDGQTPVTKRQDGVELFQTSESCRVALLSITAGGTGLTLTAANKVIFAELYWTPALLYQAEDRAHRIGQRSAINVSYIIGLGTLDEYLWPMVQRKLEILGETLRGSKESIAFEEIKDHRVQGKTPSLGLTKAGVMSIKSQSAGSSETDLVAQGEMKKRGPPNVDWACEACTLINNHSAIQCEACERPRPHCGS